MGPVPKEAIKLDEIPAQRNHRVGKLPVIRGVAGMTLHSRGRPGPPS